MLTNYSVVLFASVLCFKGRKESGKQTKKRLGKREEKKPRKKLYFLLTGLDQQGALSRCQLLHSELWRRSFC